MILTKVSMRTPEEIKTRMTFYIELKAFLKQYKKIKNARAHQHITGLGDGSKRN